MKFYLISGEAREWIPELVERASKLKVSAGIEPGADLGPVISKNAKKRILSLIESGIKEVSMIKMLSSDSGTYTGTIKQR